MKIIVLNGLQFHSGRLIAFKNRTTETSKVKITGFKVLLTIILAPIDMNVGVTYLLKKSNQSYSFAMYIGARYWIKWS